MTGPTTIHLEAATHLNPTRELTLLRTAFARTPSPVLRVRLAELLLWSDAFADAVALLADCNDLIFSEAIMLGEAWLACQTPTGDVRAGEAANHAFALAANQPQRAVALALRAKAETRLGDIGAARATLDSALETNPHNKEACKRYVALALAAGDSGAVLAMMDRLAARGAAHARLFAGRALALARRGEIAAARTAIAFDDFCQMEQLPAPDGWTSIEAFNAALAEELLTHPELRHERYGTASELTWRIDEPARFGAPLVRILLDRIGASIGDQINRLGGIDHPWIAARSAVALLRCWCVITESQGFESWHLHHFGWMSGVYYVRVPMAIVEGTDRGGCLVFGLPEDLASEEGAAAYGERTVRPREGLMLTFPSQAYHRTYPHGTSEQRICIAFDLRPS